MTDPKFHAALKSFVGVPVSGYDRPFLIGQGASLPDGTPYVASLLTDWRLVVIAAVAALVRMLPSYPPHPGCPQARRPALGGVVGEAESDPT